MATVVERDFEWDSDKAPINLRKHGVSFAEAATVFADPMAVYLDDGSGTERMVVIGCRSASGFSSSSTCSAASVTASAAHAARQAPSGRSTRLEVS